MQNNEILMNINWFACH